MCLALLLVCLIIVILWFFLFFLLFFFLLQQSKSWFIFIGKHCFAISSHCSGNHDLTIIQIHINRVFRLWLWLWFFFVVNKWNGTKICVWEFCYFSGHAFLIQGRCFGFRIYIDII